MSYDPSVSSRYLQEPENIIDPLNSCLTYCINKGWGQGQGQGKG